MNDYRIFETAEFIKKLDKLSQLDKSFIQNKLKIYVYPQIKSTHWFGKNIKKLNGFDPETWRYRIGKFRLFYLIEEKEHTIYMLTIDYRTDAY